MDTSHAEGSKRNTVQTVDFIDSNAGNISHDVGRNDPTYDYGLQEDAQLGSFLTRPVCISTLQWNQGSNLNSVIYPWREYFNRPEIKRKVDNFHLLRCKLHVKVVLNCSPYMYGAVGIGYLPNIIYSSNDILLYSVNNENALVALSQTPLFQWMYPQSNQGCEMELPFFMSDNALDITKYSDLTNMGELLLYSPVGLENSGSSGGQNVTIQVFAWATDVHLSVPTYKLALQGDEYEVDSSVSAVASAVAKASGALNRVPYIAPFARASEMVSRSVGKIAGALGFSNAPVIADVASFQPTPFGGMASSELSTPMDKLTLDTKNELTIDPTTVGIVPEDELAMKYLLTKESFVDHVYWNVADSAEHMLWGSRVNPNFLRTFNSGGTDRVISVPMAHVSRMFKYWTGTINFHVRILCSKFHRGRLQLSWDPINDNNANPLVEATNRVEIVDISECTNITFSVPWGQARTWADLDKSRTQIFSDFTAPAPQEGIDNGQFIIRVLNELTGAEATSPVHILLSVSGGENLSYADYVSPPEDQCFYLQGDIQERPIGQLGVADTNVDATVCNDTPYNQSALEKSSLIFMGEAVTSLRQLFRRSSLSMVLQPLGDTVSENLFVQNLIPRAPLFRGNDPSGYMLKAGGTPYNYVCHTPMTWMEPCFVGRRGAYNWRFNCDSPAVVNTLTVSRDNTSLRSAGAFSTGLGLAPGGSISQYAFYLTGGLYFKDGTSGMSLVSQRVQGGLNVVAPMYSKYRFMSNRPDFRTNGVSIDGSNHDSLALNWVAHPRISEEYSTEYAAIHAYVGAGLDYNLFWFSHVPFMFYKTTPSPQV